MDIEAEYNKALDYLYSFVDYSLKHSSELAKAEFNLDRMYALMEELGNPQNMYPIIHVAGTKGKGSVCALCASALKAAGYKVGLYTSPHLLDFCERIQADGEPISRELLVELVEEIKPAVAKIPKLTTFEITTALGFLAFAKQGCNAAVIEVGLGGRLDATNIVMPKVSVITSLSYDHMAVLGDTLAKIAGEKAGIIKRGVPVVSSSQKDEALEILERVARLEDSSFTLVGKDIKVYPNIGARTFSPPNERTFSSSNKRTEVRVPEFESIASSLDGQSLRIVDDLRLSTFDLQLPLLGSHQLENAATAYAALKVSGLDVSDEAIQKGFAQVKWRARFEIARREPPVIFDSAHNEDSFVKLRETLDTYFPDKKAYLIFGASEDKNIPGMFAAMKPKIQRLIVTRADHPRALEEERIVELARQAEVPYEAVSPVESALRRALELSAKDGSIVLSAGSMFVTAEVMRAWKK
ncbi:MAG: bifunctional folylpolyglutamate synthase/dihydrofolate synthase [Anaerolineae bacterium]|nr:bifunctional folylpolyglutamate synthase/dihydrofolate synthase [Anaerolineae bacterium]MBL8105474.1 bifunctional folylpolyglutamate synthase/dihydrofolate synthase [Anaerolineales bacterium]MCC7189963.1 bifunctional folylpolyglutamate synthase/dihydrofolate synthase [Anaerolineales bacterium]